MADDVLSQPLLSSWWRRLRQFNREQSWAVLTEAEQQTAAWYGAWCALRRYEGQSGVTHYTYVQHRMRGAVRDAVRLQLQRRRRYVRFRRRYRRFHLQQPRQAGPAELVERANTVAYVRRQVQRLLSPTQQYVVLGLLAGETLAELAVARDLTPSALTKTMDRLRQRPDAEKIFGALRKV